MLLRRKLRHVLGFGRRCYHVRNNFLPNPTVTAKVDLRSDTLTMPTAAMREAIKSARVGDDVYNEDPSVIALENRVASLLGHESGLFVTSGTMANLLAIMTHCSRRGDEAFVGSKSHIFIYEQAGMAQIAGVQANCLPNLIDGTFDLDLLQSRIHPTDDFHSPRSNLICIENTHCDMGGKVLPKGWLKQLKTISYNHGIPVHVDGARLLNAAVASDVAPSELAADFSSANLCLSKGVGAPVGSILVGSRDFIREARRYRKVLGGGARQIGFMAAAAQSALNGVEQRMTADHANAKAIAKSVESLGNQYVTAKEADTHTNIVLLHTRCINSKKLYYRLKRVTEEEARDLGFHLVILSTPLQEHILRLVTCSNQTKDDVNKAITKLNYVIPTLM